MVFNPIQKLSITTGSALALLGLVGVVSYLSMTQMLRTERTVAATNANIGRLGRVLERTVDAETAQRGFVTTGDERYLEPLNVAKSDVEFALDSLRAATEDNPQQRRNLEKLGPMLASRFREIRLSVSVRQRASADSAMKLLAAEKALRSRDGAGPLVQQMREEELRVLGERTRAMTSSVRKATNFILGGALLAFGLAFIALQPARPEVARRLTQRLSVAMQAGSYPELALTISEAARHAGDRLVRLQQVIAALNGPVTEADVATALLTRGAPPLVASLGFVAVVDQDGLTVVRALGDVVAHLVAGAYVPGNLVAPLNDAVSGLQPVVIESSAERSARYPSLGRFSETGTSDGAFVVVPLVAAGTVYGVMLVAFARDRVFSDDERAYLATLGRIGGQALSHAAAVPRSDDTFDA